MEAEARRVRDARRGIGAILVAMLLFTILDTMVKQLAGQGYPVGQLLFCRTLFSLPLLLLLLRGRGGWALLRTRRAGAHLGRVLIGMVALFCFFQGFRFMPLADAYALCFTAPLFLTALSVPLLGERVGWRRWTAVGVGFAGVLVMIRPGAGVLDPAALLILAGTGLYALSILAVRALSRTEASLTIVFYFSLFGTVISGLTLPVAARWPADAAAAGLMVGIGLVGGLAQLALTEAYARAPVAVIAPFDYSAMIWAIGIGYVVFGDVPQPSMLAGVLLVVGSGLYILYREARRRPPVP